MIKNGNTDEEYKLVKIISSTSPPTFELFLSYYSTYILDYDSTCILFYWIDAYLNFHEIYFEYIIEGEKNKQKGKTYKLILKGKKSFYIII